MPNTIRPSLASEVEAIAELAIDDTQKQALQKIAQTLSVRPSNRAFQGELEGPVSAVDDAGEMSAGGTVLSDYSDARSA